MSINKLSVIIVNYNSSKYTNKLCESLDYVHDILREIIIVDNNSSDINKLKLKPETKLIKNNKNLGFAKAVNQAIKKTKSKFILLLNPDTFLVDDSVKKMFDFIKKNKKIGAIGGKVISMENNKTIFTATTKPNFLTAIFEFTNFKKIFKNNYFSKVFWPESEKVITKNIEVESLCGAFILFRKNLNRNLNLFNEEYFLYLEDIDFGIKINKLGYKVIFYPGAKIVHYRGGCNNSKYRIVLKYWYDSRKKFFFKHSSIISGIILYILFSVEELILSLYHKLKNTPNE